MDELNRESIIDENGKDIVPDTTDENISTDFKEDTAGSSDEGVYTALQGETPVSDISYPISEEKPIESAKPDSSGEPFAASDATNQNGSYNPGSEYGQNVTAGSDGGYSQNRTAGPDGGYSQYGTYNPGGGYSQNGTYNPGGGYSRNRANGPYAGYGQNQTSNPNSGYGQNQTGNPNGGYGQNQTGNPNGGYGQNQTGNPNGGYDPNGPYNPNRSYDSNGSKRYSSKYDSYRFETPPAPKPSRPGDGKDSGQKKKHREPVRKQTNPAVNSTARKLGVVAGFAVLFGLVASLVFMGVTSLAGRKITSSASESEKSFSSTPTPAINFDDNNQAADEDIAGRSTGKADTDAEITELTVPQVVELCMPSMVAITNTTMEEYWDFFGGRSQQKSVSAGSGIIVGETETELLIATNNHVIMNSTDITVTFIDGQVIAGSIKGMDADNDLAILAVKLDDIQQDTRDAIKVITIGDSDAMKVGESVVAIGNALGYGQSVSAGIISALGREVKIDGQTHSLIQTDASINPGNSGGALINMRGELIGINEVKYVDETVEGVGYAIPMSTAKPILGSLGSKASREKVSSDQASYIGIKCLDVPSYYVQAGYPSGVYVSEVTKGGPADKAGLKEGDIITAMDGISVTSSSQLINYLQYYAAGETIDFSVSRLNKDNTAFESSKMPIELGSKKEAGLLESDENEAAAQEKPEEPAAPEGQAEGAQGNEAAGGQTDEAADAENSETENSEGESEWKIGDGGFPFLPDVKNR